MKILFGIIILFFTSFNNLFATKDLKLLFQTNLLKCSFLNDTVYPLEILNRNDTIIISYEGIDCGEWGGHKEIIYLNRDSLNNFIAHYIVDIVPCNDIIEKNGFGILNDEKRVIIIDTTVNLTFRNQILLNEFIQRIVELYLNPVVNEIGNFGSYYLIRNTDLTFSVLYLNSGEQMDTYYDKVRKEIFNK